MKNELVKMLNDVEFEETEEVEEYQEYVPKKMTKKEFVKEMLRLQDERNLYAD